MSNEMVRTNDGFDFAKAHEEAVERLAYYEEGLLIDVARRLIDAMDVHGISRSELARRMKVSPAYVTKVLRGHANMSLESLAKIGFAMGLKWDCILIPKDSSVRVISLTDGEGEHSVRCIETATIEGWMRPSRLNDDEYTTESFSHELRHTA